MVYCADMKMYFYTAFSTKRKFTFEQIIRVNIRNVNVKNVN